MKNSDKEELLARIDNEGFDYVFVHYSNFEFIKDKEFHELRKKFLEARENLANYIGLED